MERMIIFNSKKNIFLIILPQILFNNYFEYINTNFFYIVIELYDSFFILSIKL